MTVGVPQDLTLAVSGTADPGRTQQALGDVPGPVTVEVKAKVGRYMRATLVGGAFDITPLNPEEQDLGADRFGTWTWRVLPKQQGNQPLLLSVEAQAVGADGKPIRVSLASRNVTIRVGVSASQSAREGLETSTEMLSALEKALLALAAVIAAAGGVWLAIRHFARKKAKG